MVCPSPMFNLRNILNPEDARRRSVKLIVSTQEPDSIFETPSSSRTSPMSDVSDNVAATFAEHPAPQNHEPHKDCPDSLDCLPDTGDRPQHTLPVILRCAILGSPRKRLTIREIYAAMEAKYPYYQTAGPTWKQSVRHHLSLNRLFERQPRPVTDPGFGSYWTVNLAAPPGTKRPRKRGRQKKAFAEASTRPPKKRGRPRKTLSPGEVDDLQRLDSDDEDKATSQARPVMTTCNHGHDECSQQADHCVGDNLEYDDDQDVTEEEYESEEEMVHPMDRRSSLVGLSAYAQPMMSQPFSLPSFSTFRNEISSGDVVTNLQSEVATLRRQSAEAVSLSLRLSEQLVLAQEESSRAKATLRTVESLLEGESKRRRDAERAADTEAQRRRKAEETLNGLLARSPLLSE